MLRFILIAVVSLAPGATFEEESKVESRPKAFVLPPTGDVTSVDLQRNLEQHADEAKKHRDRARQLEEERFQDDICKPIYRFEGPASELEQLADEAKKRRDRARQLEQERNKLLEEQQEAKEAYLELRGKYDGFQLSDLDDLSRPIYRSGPLNNLKPKAIELPESFDRKIAEKQKEVDDLRRKYQPERRPAPPLPENLKGRVEDYKDGLVVINIGIDAGLTNGAKLDIYRDDDKDPRYLGTIVIERVYPKEAVAAFKPAGGKALKDLKPEELPKKTDAVGTYKGKKQE